MELIQQYSGSLLLVAVLLPLGGATLVWILAALGVKEVRQSALVTSIITLVMVAVLMLAYPSEPQQAANQDYATSNVSWLGDSTSLDVRFSIGLDGLSLWLFGLSALLMVSSILVSWQAIKENAAMYYGLLLVLETGLLGVFVARDIILFYIFFEFTLIPLFLLIGVWGGEERRLAAMKFFLFTLAGSVLTFLGLLTIVLWGSRRVGTIAVFSNSPKQVTFSIPKVTERLSTQYDTLLKELDTDENYQLSIVEVVRKKKGPEREKAIQLFKEVLFERLDTDGNGTLSAEERDPNKTRPEDEERDSKKTRPTEMTLSKFKAAISYKRIEENDWQLTLEEIKDIDNRLQIWIFLALFVGFAIKVPLFPLHTWLPLAHVQAPTAGSVILAGVLLKIGTYGFVRFSIPMLPVATVICMPWLLWISVAGIIYGALVALAQSDIKKLIAYSSVSHLGFCMLGIFALNKLGFQGGMLQMINHGISTGALFALVGMIYERYHTREISQLGGLARRTPILAMFFVLFTLSSIGLPGMNGFAGEFLLLLGMFQRGWEAGAPEQVAGQFKVIAVLALSGVVLGAWYMLWLVQRVFFGPLREPDPAPGGAPRDLSVREICVLSPLLVFVFWIGLQPQFFIRPMSPAVDSVMQRARESYHDLYSVAQDKPGTTAGPPEDGDP